MSDPGPEPVPVAAAPFEVVSLWLREPITEPDRGEAQLVIRTPRGRALTAAPMAIDLSQYRRFRSRFKVPGFPVDGYGLCALEIQFRSEAGREWSMVASVPIEITDIQPVPKAQ